MRIGETIRRGSHSLEFRKYIPNFYFGNLDSFRFLEIGYHRYLLKFSYGKK